MKTIITLTSLFLSLTAVATDVRIPVGHYKLKQINLVSAKIYEYIDTRNQPGKERIKQLQAEGWTCVAQPSNTVRCSVNSTTAELPDTLLAELKQNFFGFELHFGAQYTPTLYSEGEAIKEYVVTQDVNLLGKLSQAYFVSVTKDLTKLRFVIEKKSYYFNYLTNDSLEIIEVKSVNNGRRSYSYYIQILLQK